MGTQTAASPGKKIEDGALVPVGNRDTLRAMLSQDIVRKSMEDIIPKHLSVERLIKMALVAASRQPKLFQCTKESILQSVMRGAELGLDVSGSLGQAWLVPFYNSKLRALEAQFIPGYRGLIDLARRGKQVSSIEAHLIYEHDEYELIYGTEPKLFHKPKLQGDPGPVMAAYMVAVLADGTKQVEVMTLAQLEEVRKRSKAASEGPWVTDRDEMYRKTVVKRGVKYLPMSTEMAKAIEYDDEVLGPSFDTERIIPAEVTAGGNGSSKTASLTDKLKGSKSANGKAPEAPGTAQKDEGTQNGQKAEEAPGSGAGEDHAAEVGQGQGEADAGAEDQENQEGQAGTFDREAVLEDIRFRISEGGTLDPIRIQTRMNTIAAMLSRKAGTLKPEGLEQETSAFLSAIVDVITEKGWGC